MTVSYLTLTDDNGNAYNFPPSLFIKSQKIGVNSSIQKLLYAHGGKQIADEYIQARQIIIEGTLYANTMALFETAKRALVQALIKGGTLTISNDTVSRYVRVRLIEYDPDMEYQTFDNVSISMIAEFPFWEDSSETTVTQVLAGNGTITVNAAGSDDIMLPEIEIDADQGADVPGVKLYNSDDGGLAFQYNDPSFFETDILIINSKLGTVKKNGNDTMIYFDPPYFLRLQPGTNVLYYEGAACTVKVRYRKVYV